MKLSKFTKKFVTINSAAMLLSAAVIPVLDPRLIEPLTVHAASEGDSGVSTWSDWGTVKWGIDGNGTLWIKPQSGSTGTLESLAHNSLEKSPWYNNRSSIKSVKLEGTIIAASGCYGLFQDLTNCIDMDLASLDTSKVTDMNYMFDGCSSLAKLDVSNWNTSAVTYMSSMFDGCSSLVKLDVSNWNTSVVKDMYKMFNNCKALTSIPVGNWKTSNVTNMGAMFSDCSSLANLDVSNWDTSSVTDMDTMFNGCSGLTNLDVSKWNTSIVKDMYAMFRGCSALTSIPVSNWDTSKVTAMDSMFSGCSSLAKLDVSNWDTSNVTNMYAVFQNCKALTSISVGNWKTSKVTNMGTMFNGCSSLANLDVSTWDTSVVTDMDAMFNGCSNLANLDVSKWNTSVAKDMYAMFQNCKALTNLDVSNWDTSKVTGMDFIFNGCSSLTNLNMSNWNTLAVTNMYAMFGNCNKLSELKLGKDFIIPNGQVPNLPNPSKKGEYTGRWSKADGSNGMSASDMLNLTGQEHDATGKSLSKTLTQEDRAGTWVWERGYTVTLDPNGGSGSAKTLTAVLSQDQVFGKDSANAYISDPGYTRKAYKSNGANEKKDGTGTEYQYPFTLKTSSDKTIYAQWKAHTGTVTYNANGSTIGTSSKTGWSIAKDGTILLNGKAHHVLNGPNQAATENIAYGTQYDLIDVNNPAYLNLLRTGYHIDEHQEWNTAANGSGTVFDERKPYLAQQLIPSLENTDNAALTVYANWKPNAYTVKFDANGGAGVMADEAMTYDEAKNLTANSYTRKGYTFTGWNTKADGEGTSYTNKASAKNLTSVNNGTVTLYAQWKKTSWYDSGMNKTDPSDNDLHDPDTYIVTIPTKILKTGMSVGNVTKSISYDVNVTGNIPNGNYVHIAASTNNKLTGKNGNLELSVKQGKTVWNKTEAYGIINQDGSLSGTTALDTITINGIAKSVDRYTGLVTYSASLSTSEK